MEMTKHQREKSLPIAMHHHKDITIIKDTCITTIQSNLLHFFLKKNQSSNH